MPKQLDSNFFHNIGEDLKADFPEILSEITTGNVAYKESLPTTSFQESDICQSIKSRMIAINQQFDITVEKSQESINRVVKLFLNWMREEKIVRVIGAGRARLAAIMPANRLAHGGARVFAQDDILPMPHTIKGGGIIAASASGETPSVLETLRKARRESKDIVIVGIASDSATEFKNLCDYFIGIQREPAELVNPLRALADSEEYVISELLDAMVSAAGKLGGFNETLWRIGHENLGPTGPYDTQK